MSITEKLNGLRRAAAWVEAQGLDDIDSIELDFNYHEEMELKFYRDCLNDDQYRRLKMLFGPFEVEDAYNSKNVRGRHILSDGVEIHCIVRGAYECKKLDTSEVVEMSDEDWHEYQEKARKGLVQIVSCNEAEGAKLED